MKRNLKKIGLMLCIMFLTTGCVKMNMTMEIHGNKSMELELIEAVDDSILESTGSTSITDNKKELEDKGYTVEDYKEDNKTGYKITKHFDNIDTVSSSEEIDTNVSDVVESDQFFTVKKGFFKNTYQINMKSVDYDSLGMDDAMDTDVNDNEVTGIDDTTGDGTLDFGDDFDYSSMLSGMDVAFHINLPNKAISNNATKVENNGKNLTWDLMEFKGDKIELEFALYNMTNIYITIGIGLFLLLILIAIIVKIVKKPKSIVLEPTGDQTPLHPVHEEQQRTFTTFPTNSVPNNTQPSGTIEINQVPPMTNESPLQDQAPFMGMPQGQPPINQDQNNQMPPSNNGLF